MVRDEGKLEGVDRGIPLCWRDKGGNGVILVNGSGRRQGRQCERDGECVPFGASQKGTCVVDWLSQADKRGRRSGFNHTWKKKK